MLRRVLFAIAALTLICFCGGVALLDADFEELSEIEHVFARNSDFYKRRAYPFKEIPPGALFRAVKQLERNGGLRALASDAVRQWRPLGPFSVPNGQPFDLTKSSVIPVSGRATAIVVDRNNSNRIFLGTAQGGVWRSTDAGRSWMPLTDKLPSLSVGALAADPNNAETLYLGTGEANFTSDSYYGAGVFKSTDSGESWIAAGELPLRACISRIIVDPNNSLIVYLAASYARTLSAGSKGPDETGIFRSVDGGKTWERVLAGTATELSINPLSPSDLIAALGDPFGNQANGVYRTTNAGQNWQLISALPNGSSVGRIELARAPSNPSTVYVSISLPGTMGLLNLYKSVDGGGSWTTLRAPDYCGRQCFYDNILAVHPNDPDVLFLGGVALFRSKDGGKNFENVSGPKTFGPGLHSDIHAVVFDTRNANGVYVANDGGLFFSLDLGDSWMPLNDGLATLQFTSASSHPTDERRIVGGTQDNGTLLYTGLPQWMQIDQGDGGEIVIDPANPATIYHFYFSLLLARSDDGGRSFRIRSTGLPIEGFGFSSERSLFYAPLAIDPLNTAVLYTGSFRIYRTPNRAELWFPISRDLTKGNGAISAITVAPNDSRTIYVGTSDGNAARSTDGGTTWQSINSGLPNRFVSRFAVNPSDSKTVYAIFSGFGSGHVFKTLDGGESWIDVSGNLPDVPANAIALDAQSPNTIYIGTDIGVFVSRSGGGIWRIIDAGLPRAAVFDLDLNRRTGQLTAATHGRGMFALPLDGDDDITPPQVFVESPRGGEIFKAGDSVRILWSASDDGALIAQDIELSTDGGETYNAVVASGLGGDVRSFQWSVPETATMRAKIRITARDEAGNVGRGASAADFKIDVPPRPIISRARFKNSGDGKLIIDGEGLIVNDTVVEIDGRRLAVTKYPKAFQTPSGMTTRLQGLDPGLKQLIPSGRKAIVTLFNAGTNRRSAPFEFQR